MKGHAQVINALNKILANELTAINQFFLHARMYKNWGFEGLNKATYGKSIQDMKHADKLIERILFLEGMPNLQELHKLMIGEDAAEMLKHDLALEMECHKAIKAGIVLCEKNQDYVSRELLDDLLEEEEAHIDWLEMQQDLIEKVGLENYLQEKMGENGGAH